MDTTAGPAGPASTPATRREANPCPLLHAVHAVRPDGGELRRPLDALDHGHRGRARTSASTPSRWATSSRPSAGPMSIGQIPGGWLLDRFGSQAVYCLSLFGWSLFTLLQGCVGLLRRWRAAVDVLFALRFLVGLAESPSFPANGRIVAAWFPTAERGTASAIFNSAQYFATVLFAPIMGWITHAVRLALRVLLHGRARPRRSACVWFKVDPQPEGPSADQPAELDYIEHGGGAGEHGRSRSKSPRGSERPAAPAAGTDLQRSCSTQPHAARHLSRPVLHQRADLLLPHLVPDLSGQGARPVDPAGRLRRLAAGDLRLRRRRAGRLISDADHAQAGSLTLARKTPIVGGMLLSTSIVACNYVDGRRLVVGDHGARLLRQGHRRARLGRDRRRLAEGDRRPDRRRVQHLRQHRRRS